AWRRLRIWCHEDAKCSIDEALPSRSLALSSRIFQALDSSFFPSCRLVPLGQKRKFTTKEHEGLRRITKDCEGSRRSTACPKELLMSDCKTNSTAGLN